MKLDFTVSCCNDAIFTDVISDTVGKLYHRSVEMCHIL